MPKKKKPEEALAEMQALWPDYDFSKFNYVGSYSESTVICPKHGERTRTFKNITRKWGSACDRCASNTPKNTEIFLEEIKTLYPETWEECTYEKVQYTTALSKVVITCKKHGEFEIQPSNLCFNPRGNVCPKCNIANRSRALLSTKEKFLSGIPEGRDLLDKFDKVNYEGRLSPVEMICKDHGSYLIKPSDYTRGRRCNKCANKISTGETEVLGFVRTMYPSAIQSKRFDPELKRELDVYIPELNLGIEYNGLYFHREIDLELDKHKGRMASSFSLLNKTQVFSNIGIRVIHIFEDEWLDKRGAVENRLRSILGFNSRIYARKCSIRNLTDPEVKVFEETHHLQGHPIGSICNLGLFLDEKLVASMTFSKLRYESTAENEYELLRFCSKGTVVGGFTKLLSKFIRDFSPKKVISYSDRRWSIGEVYQHNGFITSKPSNPGYFWCKGQKRYSRVTFQRHKLEGIFNEKFPTEMSESEIMYSKGYSKVLDCGQDRWELVLN